ncbi:hypothetical protein DFP93_101226 [Aneurinibacillus soli]|uniref:Uncharacterized protein n=1 Tax=Aneurinibacillus soli TaxID=1500254 RepID=A0A0U5B997_9BACL|nr:hypothetical protein [Aneurinibacillus soli]PYE64201.1 hypothetical protein DFP93_101226 [Aneurinibacillus soli]BAU28150.1 hypothetical protein CB4_02324 [Aneurinibacillus soli]
MGTPTPEQLQLINNRFAKAPLKSEQVYVFECIAADTLPVLRKSWYGEYTITMTDKMLVQLMDDFKQGCALLASHNSWKLPFGRTFDARVGYETVDDKNVNTMRIWQYMVTHTIKEDGSMEEIHTEVGKMSTKDIASHIDAGTIFDTSIGFVISSAKCSVCEHDVRSEKCGHYPGKYYVIDEQAVRCDIIAEDGQGIENSLVFSGAVDRATITASANGRGIENSETEEKTVYSIDDIKKVPLDEPIVCHYSKHSGVEWFTRSSRRIERPEELASEKEMKDVSGTNVEFKDIQLAFAKAGINFDKIGDVSSAVGAAFAAESAKATEEMNKQLEAKDAEFARVSAELDKLKTDFSDAQSKIMELTDQKEELSKKAELVEQYRKDLIEATVEAGIRVMGNTFNKERQEKYLSTLSIDELKEEKAAYEGQFQERFAGSRTTKPKQQAKSAVNGEMMRRSDFENEQEFRTYVGKEAMKLSRKNGTNVADETMKLYRELSEEDGE